MPVCTCSFWKSGVLISTWSVQNWLVGSQISSTYFSIIWKLIRSTRIETGRKELCLVTSPGVSELILHCCSTTIEHIQLLWTLRNHSTLWWYLPLNQVLQHHHHSHHNHHYHHHIIIIITIQLCLEMKTKRLENIWWVCHITSTYWWVGYGEIFLEAMSYFSRKMGFLPCWIIRPNNRHLLKWLRPELFSILIIFLGDHHIACVCHEVTYSHDVWASLFHWRI